MMSWSKTTPSTRKAQRDDEFYFKDIIFLVEDRLFKVPARNFITESEVFETMFKMPQNPDIAADGQSDDHPLRLEGVKSDDFRQLLRVMYPSGIGETEALMVAMEQWISVLQLSTQWDMTRIRTQAIKNVRATLGSDDLPPKLLNLGQTYHVDEWVIDSITSFIKRKEPMGLNDVETIGIENILKIASLRESCLKHDIWMGGKVWVGETEMTERIKQVFGLSLSSSESGT